MKIKHASLMIATLALGAAAVSGSALADKRDRDHRDHKGPSKWEDLGCQKVGFLVDHDSIKVGRREGRFKAIRLKVSGNAVYINDLKVIYANGKPDDLRVRSEIRDGGETRPLDLQGRERAIQRIDLVYRAKPNFKGTARVCVEGRS